MACSGIKRPKQCLTLSDKLEILKIYDSIEGNVKLNELTKTLNISRSTLLTIVSNRKSIENAPESDRHRYRTRNKRNNPYAGKSKYLKLDEALANWVREIKMKGEPFNGVILRSKALELAAKMGFENFTASNGWSDRFKKKYDFEYKSMVCCCKNRRNLKSKPVMTNYGAVNFLDKMTEHLKSKGSKLRNQQHKKKLQLVELEKRLIQWLQEAKNDKAKINGSLMKEMALNLAGILGVTKFRASSSWLNHFQKKYELFNHKRCENCRRNTQQSEAEEADNENSSNGEKVSHLIKDQSKETPEENFDLLPINTISRKRRLENAEKPMEKINQATDEAEDNEDILNKRMSHFKELSNKIAKEEEYQKIKLRLDKLEIDLEVIRLAKKLLKAKKTNLRLEAENLRMRLQILQM